MAVAGGRSNDASCRCPSQGGVVVMPLVYPWMALSFPGGGRPDGDRPIDGVRADSCGQPGQGLVRRLHSGRG